MKTLPMTAFWARPYNDNYVGNADGDQKNFMDNMDMAGLMVPLTFDGVKLTPLGHVRLHRFQHVPQ